MAEFWSNNDRGYRIRLWIDQTSQNIAGNSSRVRVRLALLNTTTAFAQYSCSAYVDLNGQRLNWSGSPNMTSYNSTIMLIDETITVSHNADGTKTFGLMASFSGSGGYSPGTLSIGGNVFTLITIPRSSSVSVGAGVIGSDVTINISRQSSSFKHTVRYHWGNKSGTIASNVDTSTTWTIPLDFANDIPNSTSGTGTIYVDTYSGSTKIGTASSTLTASVPASVKPSFTGITLTDLNTTAQNLITGNNFLQIISNIKVTFNGGAGSYGSSITGYKAEIVGKNQTTNVNGGALGIMNYNGAITIRASVSDSRGRWSDTRDVSVTVLEYFVPALSFNIARTGSTSSTFAVTRNARVAPLAIGGAQKNIMTLSFKVARIGTTTYTADTGAAAGSWTSLSSFTNSQANLSGSYAANQSWVVIGALADRFIQTEFAVNVATESVVFSYDRSGVGVNKIRELGALDVNGDIYANGNSIQHHRVTENNGSCINTSTNPDFITNSGMYYLLNGPGRPNNRNGFLLVEAYSDQNYVSQKYTDVISGVQLSRVGVGGTWKQWKETILSGTDTEFPKVNIVDTATSDFPIMFGVGISAMRKGNLVTLTVNRAVKNINSKVEYGLMNETIPAGYRPIKEAHLIMQANAGTTISGTAVVHLAPDGKVRLTNNITGDRFWAGTITYITNDPYP